MTDYFGLKAALAQYVGSADLAGIILGIALMITFMVAIQWMISGGKPSSKQSDFALLISAAIGMGIATMLEWFPVYILLGVVIIVLFARFGPGLHRGAPSV